MQYVSGMKTSYYRELEAQSAMAVVAGWMGRNRKVRVTYHDGKAVCADIYTGEIRVPKLACASGLTEEALMTLRTQVYHEAGHIAETKMAKHDQPAGALFKILNALEDRRMERVLREDHLGCKTVLRWGTEYYNKKVGEHIMDGEGGPLWEALCAMSFMVEGIIPAWKVTPKAQRYVDAAYAEFSKVMTCGTTYDCLELAKHIYELLKEENEKFNDEQKPEQKSKPKNSKKPDKSDKDESSDDSGEGEPGEDESDDGESSEGESEESKEEKEEKKKKGKSKKSDDEDDDDESDEDDKGGKESDEGEKDEDSDKGKSDDDDSDEDSDSDEGESESDEEKGDEDDGGADAHDELDDEAESADSEKSDDESDGTKTDDSAAESDKSTISANETKSNEEVAYKPDDSGLAKEQAKTDLEEEADGATQTEVLNENLEEMLRNLPPEDAEYLALRDNDIHQVPESTDLTKQEYQNERGQIAVMVATMTRALEQALRSMTKCKKNPYLRHGRIDRNRLVAIAKGLSKEVFFHTRQGETLDVAVEIILDESGSMRKQNRVISTRLLAIAIGETLAKLGIPFEITGSTTTGGYIDLHDGFTRVNPIRFMHYKSFEEEWGAVKDRICHTGAYNNNVDGEIVEFAAHRLAGRKEGRKIIFSLSDGKPCAGQNNDSVMCYNLIRVCELVREAGIEVYGFGIETEAPKSFYGEKYFIYLESIEKMGESFVRMFADIVTKGKVHV